MKITTKHHAAIAQHVADALGDTDTSRAEVTIEAMGLTDGSTYATLAAVTQPVVTEALADAGVKVPSLRRGTIAALFGLVREGAPTCTRCGRLALRLSDAAWSPVTEATCPVDAGLYEAERVETVRAWSDGREYPAGTTHDADRVPLTESLVRARGVADAVIDACRETGATLLDFLAALVTEGTAPVKALAIVMSPLAERFIDADKVREFAQRARGALSRRAGGATPPFAAGGEVASGAVDPRALREELASLYPDRANVRRVAVEAGVNTSRVDLGGSPVDVWFNVIAEAAKTGRVGALIAVAQREYPNCRDMRALTEAPSRDAVLATLTRLLPSQFESVVFRLSAATHHLPPATATLSERATALVRLMEQQGRLAELASLAGRA